MSFVIETLLSLVVFQITTESLLQFLCLVLVFEYYFAVLRNTFNGKTDWSFLTILWQSHLFDILSLDNFGLSDFVGLNLALDEHFVINKLASGIGEMLLLQNIVFGICECLFNLVPALGLILLVRNSDSDELFEGLGIWIVANDDELRPEIIFVVVDGAFQNGVVLRSNAGCDLACLNSSILLKSLGQNFFVLLITDIHGI